MKFVYEVTQSLGETLLYKKGAKRQFFGMFITVISETNITGDRYPKQL